MRRIEQQRPEEPALPIRLLLYAWAGLTTLPGLCALLLGLATGGGVRRRGAVIEAWGGGIAWLLARTPVAAQAMALGHVILGRTPEALDRLRDHELAHVRQAEKWGPFFLPAYAMASIIAVAQGRHYYRDNFFEIDARAAEAAGPPAQARAPGSEGPAEIDHPGEEAIPPGSRLNRSLPSDSHRRS